MVECANEELDSKQCMYSSSSFVIQKADILKSGTPAVDGKFLAPTENGIQLVRIPEPEFIARCQKTPGISAERARAFWEKLWILHIDARRAVAKVDANATKTTDDDTEPAKPEIPFQERLRPGMFVRATRIQAGNEKPCIAMLLCPEGSMKSLAAGARPVRLSKIDGKRYICATVSPATYMGAYDVNVQRQIVVSVEDMDEEVFINYDSATRYHFLTV